MNGERRTNLRRCCGHTNARRATRRPWWLLALLSLHLCANFATSQPLDQQPFSGKVVGVQDGDTITVLRRASAPGQAPTLTPVRIRLYGIDAPENGQAFGQAAKRAASQLCFGKQVTVAPRGQDRYGRLLALVTLPDGEQLNLRLVANGWAWHYRRYDQSPDFHQAEAEARRLRRGLWQQSNPLPPWEHRQQRARP